MPEPDQMIDRLPAPLDVPDHDRMHERPRVLIIYENDGHPHFGQQGKIERTDPRGSNDDAVDAPLRKRLDHLLLAVWIGVGIGQKHRIAEVVGGLFNPTGHFARKRIGNGSHYQADGQCPLGD